MLEKDLCWGSFGFLIQERFQWELCEICRDESGCVMTKVHKKLKFIQFPECIKFQLFLLSQQSAQ
jgi:hypothetical protein